MKKPNSLYIAADASDPVTLSANLPSRLDLRLVLVLLCVLSGCGKPPVAPPQSQLVRTFRAKSIDARQVGGDAAYLALVRAEEETDLSFKVGGIVENIGPGLGWTEGTAVKAGTNLAILKQSDFENGVNSARADADLTRKQLERFQALRAKDAVSQQELDVAEAKAQTAEAKLKQAEQDRAESHLEAPVDGVVLARYINAGQTVAPGKPVLRFANTRRMQVELGVPDRLVSYFKPGKAVGVEISALEGHAPFPGYVSEVGVAARQEGRLFRVVIKVDNQDGLLRSGMTATIRVGEVARFNPDSVLVPLSALVTAVPTGRAGAAEAPQLAVFVVKDGKAVRRLVKTGDIIRSSIVVTEGLKPEDEVVTGGNSFLYDGQPVEVQMNLPTGE